MDEHFHRRYWETLNFYPHKCFVQQKREPWTGVEYLISFVWPTQTQYGWRNHNDANEASGINAYCFANYARYYGDWATLRANWNHCRRLHEFLPRVNDWAPAELLGGSYDPDARELDLRFRSREGAPFGVKIYTQRAPRDVTVNGQPVAAASPGWTYDVNSGWLVIHLEGNGEQHTRIRLGEPVAPLHPYFTKTAVH